MIMRTAYRVIAYPLALSVAVQASLIAFGAFALENNIDNGPVSDGDTTGVTLHHSFAYVVVLFAVALLAVSFGAKVQHGVRWAAIPLGLVVVQFFLAYAAYSAAIVGVLHGLNALAIFAVALLAGRRVPRRRPRPSRRPRRRPRSDGPVRPSPRLSRARPRAAMRATPGHGLPDCPPSRLTAIHVEPELTGDYALAF
jgi:hypothetical protein